LHFLFSKNLNHYFKDYTAPLAACGINKKASGVSFANDDLKRSCVILLLSGSSYSPSLMGGNPAISMTRPVGFPDLLCSKGGINFVKGIILRYEKETMRQIVARQFVAALIG